MISKDVNRELSARICELLGIDPKGLLELSLSIAVGQLPIVRTDRYVREICQCTSPLAQPFRCSEIHNKRKSQTFSIEFDAPPNLITEHTPQKEIED